MFHGPISQSPAVAHSRHVATVIDSMCFSAPIATAAEVAVAIGGSVPRAVRREGVLAHDTILRRPYSPSSTTASSPSVLGMTPPEAS